MDDYLGRAELASASILETALPVTKWTLKQVQGEGSDVQ
jgi:hypothetical protein